MVLNSKMYIYEKLYFVLEKIRVCYFGLLINLVLIIFFATFLLWIFIVICF